MTKRRIRVALQLEPQHAEYSVIRDAAGEAEELGVDVLFNWDHFFPLSAQNLSRPGLEAPDPRDGLAGQHFECWTMLAAWAQQTTRVELGPLVSCNNYRNPDLLADMARTVDHVSGGRVILGIGSGWFERDFTEYGYDFGTAAGRIRQLAEALPRIERRWAALNPAPVRRIPVLIGGGGERMTLPLVARHADIWHWFSEDVATFVAKSAVLDEQCVRIDRDPAEIERSVGVPRGRPQDAGPALLAAGATLFTVGASGPRYDLSTLRSWLAWRDSL